ncbi:MAG: VWA domain-containing protein, partial [Bacilli bacterium]|nr:VWA domain-containing protein [Bacilli bacterium]
MDYVTQANIKLGINFSKEQELDKIKYKTTCGDISNNKLEIIWNLQDATGKCVIEASYKMKKIKKEYNVIPKDIDNKELALDYNIDLDDDDDLDFDGLTNKQEREYKTNPLLYDSDMDGLSDYDEIITYKTDPNKKDTDDDGISDYDEIKLGLDPLKKDSKGDGVSDGERTLTFAYKSDKLQMNIKGKGNIASTEVDITTNTKISGKKGLIDRLYSFYTEGKLSEALLTITYDDDDLIKYGLNEDNLTIFYYNEKDLKYEKVDTILNKENKTLTTTLKHFSKYVVGDSSLTKEKIDTEILFILDNSWSMYTNEQYEEITGKDTLNNSFDGSDSTGSRFSLTSDLISKLAKKDYKIGLSEFRNDYANALKIGSDEKDLKEKLEQMNGKFITSIAGTNINSALNGGISEFSNNNDNNKYIVLLTDGGDSSLWAYKNDIIDKAISKNIKVCSIGFGNGTNNSNLANISNTTGCKFYSSSDVNGLVELFDDIKTELDDNLVDIDGDDTPDGMLIADSGFIVNRDGFSFKNYGTNLSSGGHCYGMATFAQLYYKKQLPLKLDSKTVKNDKSYAYN